MFYHLFYPLRDVSVIFNVFRYITFRAALASVTAFFISLFLGPIVIRFLSRRKMTERVRRKWAPTLYKLHKDKEGTPTMGGLIIIGAICASTLLWADITNQFVQISLLTVLWMGVIGFMDDYKKMKKETSGLRAVNKFFWQLFAGLAIGIILFFDNGFSNTIHFPFFKNLVLNLGIFYILFVALVIVATTNSVNLTDGLDGLAIGCVVIIALTYCGMSYFTGNVKFSNYLNIFCEPRAAELAIFCASIFGAGLGFLWFNSYPATIFMGDTGSLALGGAIGTVAVFIKKEILLLLVGGIFVAEALSVIIQVVSFKLTGKRVFLMAPLHHHYEHKGWPESKIIIRFWIIAIILALLTLLTLKLR